MSAYLDGKCPGLTRPPWAVISTTLPNEAVAVRWKSLIRLAPTLVTWPC